MNEYEFIVKVKHRSKISKRRLAVDIKNSINGIYPYNQNGEDCAAIKNVSVRCAARSRYE
jgi:hypothetical protein